MSFLANRSAVEAVLSSLSPNFSWQDKPNGQLLFSFVGEIEGEFRKASISYYTTSGKLLVQGQHAAKVKEWIQEKLRDEGVVGTGTSAGSGNRTGSTSPGFAALTDARQRSRERKASGTAGTHDAAHDELSSSASSGSSSSASSSTTPFRSAFANSAMETGRATKQLRSHVEEALNSVFPRSRGLDGKTAWELKPNGHFLFRVDDSVAGHAGRLCASVSYYGTSSKLLVQGASGRTIEILLRQKIGDLEARDQAVAEAKMAELRRAALKRMARDLDLRRDREKREVEKREREANEKRNKLASARAAAKNDDRRKEDNDAFHVRSGEYCSDESEDSCPDVSDASVCSDCLWYLKFKPPFAGARYRNYFDSGRGMRHHCIFRGLWRCGSCRNKWASIGSVWDGEDWCGQNCRNCEAPGFVCRWEVLEAELRNRYGCSSENKKPHESGLCGLCRKGKCPLR